MNKYPPIEETFPYITLTTVSDSDDFLYVHYDTVKQFRNNGANTRINMGIGESIQIKEPIVELIAKVREAAMFAAQAFHAGMAALQKPVRFGEPNSPIPNSPIPNGPETETEDAAKSSGRKR